MSDSTSETYTNLLAPYAEQIKQLRLIGSKLWNRGWSVGTSSNYSVVIDRNPIRLLITASGKDKGHLGPNDFVIVDENGKVTPEKQSKSSAETLLHCSAVKSKQANAVLHTHSVWGTILSEKFAKLGGIELSGFEMQKGLEGITTHDSKVWIPIYENTQDIPELRQRVEKDWNNSSSRPCWGYLIRKHGLYTWGNSLDEANRHIEVIEFLLECFGRQLMLH